MMAIVKQVGEKAELSTIQWGSTLRHVPQIIKVIRQAFTSLLVSMFPTESSQVSGYTIAHQMNVRPKE
jgi:hypothetical protein